MAKINAKKAKTVGKENMKASMKTLGLKKETVVFVERGMMFGDVVLDHLDLFIVDWKDYGSAAIGLAKAVAALNQEARNQCIPVDKLFQSQLEHFEKVFSNID